MSAFADLPGIGPQQIWDGVLGRIVHGDRITLGVIELDADSLVPEHRHENEQLGVLLRGSLLFRIGEETRELEPGATWCIPGGVPHEVRTGPAGAVVVEVWTPPRRDWESIARDQPSAPRWPPDP